MVRIFMILVMLPLHAVLLWGYSPTVPAQPPPWWGKALSHGLSMTLRGDPSGVMISRPTPHSITSSSSSHHYTVTKHPLIPSLSVFPAIITMPWPGTAPKTTHHGSHQSKPILPTTSPGNTYHTIAPNNLPFKPPHYLCSFTPQPSLYIIAHPYSTPNMSHQKHTHKHHSLWLKFPIVTYHTCEPSSPTPFFMNNFLFFMNKVPHITHQRSEPQSLAMTKSHALAIHNLPLHPPHPQANPHPCQNHIDLTITIPQHCQLKHPHITNLKSTPVTINDQIPSLQPQNHSACLTWNPIRCSHIILSKSLPMGQPATHSLTAPNTWCPFPACHDTWQPEGCTGHAQQLSIIYPHYISMN